MPSPSDVMNIYYGIVFNYCEFSGLALLFYDYLVTLPREISLVWRWPWRRRDEQLHHRHCEFRPSISISSLLYILTRYTLLVSWILSPILSLNPTIHRSVITMMLFSRLTCTPWLRLAQTMDIVSQTTVALILLLRTYALWGQNIMILVLVGTVGLSIPGIGIWSIVLTNCVFTFDASIESQLKLITMLFSLLTVIFDTLIMTSTVYRYYELRGMTGLGEGGLLRLIIHNGFVHYALLFAAHLSTVIIYWAAPMQLIGAGNYIARSLSVNIVSHFMLDLRKMTKRSVAKTTTETTTTEQTLSFVTFHDAELMRRMRKRTERDEEDISATEVTGEREWEDERTGSQIEMDDLQVEGRA